MQRATTKIQSDRNTGRTPRATATRNDSDDKIDMLACGFDLDLNIVPSGSNAEVEEPPVESGEDNRTQVPMSLDPPCRDEILEQLMAALDVEVNPDAFQGMGPTTFKDKTLDDFQGLLGQDEMAIWREVDGAFPGQEEPTWLAIDPDDASKILFWYEF